MLSFIMLPVLEERLGLLKVKTNTPKFLKNNNNNNNKTPTTTIGNNKVPKALHHNPQPPHLPRPLCRPGLYRRPWGRWLSPEWSAPRRCCTAPSAAPAGSGSRSCPGQRPGTPAQTLGVLMESGDLLTDAVVACWPGGWGDRWIGG